MPTIHTSVKEVGIVPISLTPLWKIGTRRTRTCAPRNDFSEKAIMPRQYYVYIVTNDRNSVLYTGVTNDLKKRVYQHKEKLVKGFSERYNTHKLVYYEVFEDSYNAITREKQIKAGSRKRKMELINKMNKLWNDLSDEL